MPIPQAPQPSPEDLDAFSRGFEWLFQKAELLLTGIGGIILLFVWRVSSRVTKYEATQEEHDKAIKELQGRRVLADAKIETLATKDDLADIREAITGEFRARMSDMTTLITRGAK